MVSDANFFDLNENQRKLLKQIYDKFEHPDEAILEELVKLTGLNIMIVKAWFKNERKKAKKEQKEEMKRKKKMLKKRNKQNGKPSDSSYLDLSDRSSSSGDDSSSSSSYSSSSSEEEDSDKEEKKMSERKEIITEKEKKLLEAFFLKEKKTTINAGIIEELAEKLNVRTKLVEDWYRQNCGKQQQENKNQNATKTMVKNVGNGNANQPSTSSSFAANNPPTFGMGIKNEQQTIGIGKGQSATSPTKPPFKRNNNTPPPTYENAIQKIGGSNGGVGPAFNIFRIILVVVLLFITMTIFLLMQNSQTIEILENSNQNEQPKLFLGIPNNKTEGNKDGKIIKRKSTLGKATNGFDDFEEDEKLYGPEFEILPMEMENEIGIEQINIQKLLDEKEFMEKEIGEELAGFRWELVAKKRKTLKTMNQILAIFVRAKPIYGCNNETFNFKAKIDFIIKLADSKYSTNAEYSIIQHSQQCNFNSKNGGKCGFIFGIQNLKKQIALKIGKSIENLDMNLVANIKAQFTLHIPATKESIEQI